VLAELGRNLVEEDGNANDPGKKRRLFDNSGHGTGTIGILAGGAAPDIDNIVIGGAPEADILPVRIAQSVILLFIAVCGVMADQKPYADLKGLAMEGSFGPDAAMKAALAAYTPNIPSTRLGCEKSVRRNGEGTSAATPQVAAAVALWFEKWKARLRSELNVLLGNLVAELNTGHSYIAGGDVPRTSAPA
jgi:hypothetical protein